ncbi:MAG: hypothetical protein LBU51_07015 [Bacteroidales bacterium]|jgi:hypothetical protein|nr:hypothetical protein [Bacteroidales bacterium]
MQNIENLLKLYENLHALNKPLAELLSDVLPSLSVNNWWKDCVINKLEEQDVKLINRKRLTKLDELDIGILLKILINNWYTLANMYNTKFNTKKAKLTREIRDIRNFTAHPNETEVSSADFITYFERLQKFAEFIGTDINYSVEMLYKNNDANDYEKRNKLLELIKNKVLTPAIDSQKLNADIKESVKDTLNHLEGWTTSKEIYTFFYYALDARRGKQVYNALKNAGLNAFEDIIDDFFNIYWGKE